MNKFAQVLKRQQVVLNPGPFDQKVRRSATGDFEPRSPRPKVRRCTTRPPRPTIGSDLYTRPDSGIHWVRSLHKTGQWHTLGSDLYTRPDSGIHWVRSLHKIRQWHTLGQIFTQDRTVTYIGADICPMNMAQDDAVDQTHSAILPHSSTDNQVLVIQLSELGQSGENNNFQTLKWQ